MNIFKKAFCRVYQFCFYLALPVLPYREPEKLKSTDEITKVLKNKNIDSVLLVTDKFLRESGLTAPLEKSLEENFIKCSVYDKTRPNPTTVNVDEAYRMYVENSCGALIAFGGGSAMDCAKAAGARVAYKGKSIEKLKGNLRVWRKLPTFFAIPTTAGTGSEVTVTAVITDDVKRHKYTMNSFPLIPHFAVLDASVTYTLPPHLTSTTGMDAMTHAVEAYIGNSTSKETRRLSKEAVKLVVENVELAYNAPRNHTARENMLLAAHKAGIAFSKSYVGYVHAVAHSLGGQYNTPHGLANSVLMPIVLEAYGERIHKKLWELAVYAGIADEKDSFKDGAEKFINKVKTLNKNMGIPTTLNGIKEEDISAMAKHADREGNPLYPVPVLMGANELEKFYYAVMEKSI